jgi:hypothetical protein
MVKDNQTDSRGTTHQLTFDCVCTDVKDVTMEDGKLELDQTEVAYKQGILP